MKGKRKFGFYTRITTIVILLLSFVLPAGVIAAEGQADAGNFPLTIMHMNDTHARVEQLPKMVTAVKEIRKENPDSLLLHAGDVFSGTLYFNEYKGQADLAMFNLMGINAATFGNHEFDLGDKENGHKSLSEFVKKAHFPFLGTNIDFSGDPFMKGLVSTDFFTANPEKGKVFNGIIKEINGEKVGIFGLTTGDTIDIASPVNVKFSNYIEQAERSVAEFESLGINKIIALTHLGYDSDPRVGNDLTLAKTVKGIDIIVGGHSHTKLGKPAEITTDVNGNEKDPTLIVHAYQYADFLGKLDVVFDKNGVIAGYDGKLIELKDKAADQEAAEQLKGYKTGIDALQNEKIGAVALKDLTNPRLSDSDVSVRANETELGNLVTDAMLAKAKTKYPDVVIAMQNGGGIRAPIAKGAITVGQVINVLPFGNDPIIVTLSGAEIKALLELSVRSAPKEDGGFLHVAGMKFKYDSTKELGNRVVSMEVNIGGKFVPIELDKKYLVTTNNFTGKGGDGLDVFAKAYAEGRAKDIGEIDWQQLRDYMVQDLKGQVDPVIEGRIIDLKGASAEGPEQPGNGDGDGTGNGNGDGTGTGSGDENTPTPGNGDGSGSDIDKGSDNSQDIGKEKGAKLPNTATNTYTLLLMGVLLIILGGSGLFVYRRRSSNMN